MIKLKNTLTITLLISMVACTPPANSLSDGDTPDSVATAKLDPKSGSEVVGVARFEQQGDNVVLLLSLSNATPGPHGVHLHENGDCSAPDGNSAGGHWNPTEDSHGEWGSDHYHFGDIGNIMVDTLGNGTLRFETDKWNLEEVNTFSVLGKSVVIHSGTDDLISQPSGDAGYKVACGVIRSK
jgi:Cu-Zn family superoxide dismutase